MEKKMLKTIKQTKIVLLLFIAAHALFTNIICNIRLSDFDFNSASVLIYHKEGNTGYYTLTSEAAGRDKGTFDDFGGKRDKGENHPIVTAAREFHEEAIIGDTLNLNLKSMRRYLNKNAKHILAYTTKKGSGQVTYVITWSESTYNQWCNSFYQARKNAIDSHNREKNIIADIEENDLKDAICNQNGTNNITVPALVKDPATGERINQMIILRPFYVMKTRGFMCDEPYVRGVNKKVKFYSDAPIHSTEGSLECPAL
jgi:hypothetical protein